MLVPRYWSEAKRRHRDADGRFTIQRWGWSNTSQQEADQHAQTRVDEAFAFALAAWPGTRPDQASKRELKTAYNGSVGVPIREEVLDQRGDTVISRNGYGAHCLNTPNVLFVDVDEEALLALPRPWRRAAWWGVWATTLLVFFWWMNQAQFALPCKCNEIKPVSRALGHFLLYLGLSAVLIRGIIAPSVRRQWLKFQGGLPGFVSNAIKREISLNPASVWQFYRTPAGGRLVALHRHYDPQDPETKALMTRFAADPLYELMCRRQNCFRARVSAKPWRIPGIDRMRGPVWPVAGEALDRRQLWTATYEPASNGYAACALMATYGDSFNIDPQVAAVIDWHDELSQAKSGKPLA